MRVRGLPSVYSYRFDNGQHFFGRYKGSGVSNNARFAPYIPSFFKKHGQVEKDVSNYYLINQHLIFGT